MHEMINPEGWKPAQGYANAVIASGRTLYLAGQIGWNADQRFETDDLVGQIEQTLSNIRTILECAGAGPEHLVRLTWFVTDKRAYLDQQKAIGAVYRAVIGRHFPAMSVVEVSSLLEERAQVEIEATAVLPEG
ncbi:MAG: RidA family protein [Alphaproteobacteria bacterium]|nr:RidA family protein [Alphaproteobacteria bacterium]